MKSTGLFEAGGGMIEIAIGYLGAFLTRRALGLFSRAETDAGKALDDKLGELYDWVKNALFGRPAGEASLAMLEEKPEGAVQQKAVGDLLAQAVDEAPKAKAQLADLVAELDRMRPDGVTLEGLATAVDVYGTNVGVDTEGDLQPGDRARGQAVAGTLHRGGENIGLRHRSRG